MLDQATKIYKKGTGEDAHLARCQFKKGQLLARKGNGTGALAAWELARRLRQKICRDDIRPVEELRESDYDELIDHWAR
jgi:predicted negative regulator of RcsB-dependent stress response